MAEKRFKKIFMWPYKKYLTYGHNFGCTNKCYLLQKHPNFLTMDKFLRDLYSQRNVKRVGQALNFRITILLIMVPL